MVSYHTTKSSYVCVKLDYCVSEQVFSSEKCSLEKSCLIKVFLFFFKEELFSYIWKDFSGFAGDTKAREGL